MEQQRFIENILRAAMAQYGFNPVGVTFEASTETDRIEVQLSHFIGDVCSVNPLTAALFNVTRPLVDQSLTAIVATVPQRPKGQQRKKIDTECTGHVFVDGLKTNGSATVTKKRKRSLPKMGRWGKQPQIIDAEFEMIPSSFDSCGKEK